MKLNMDILCDYLPKNIQFTRFGTERKNTTFGWPIFYSADCTFEDGCLYIARTEMLPPEPPRKEIALVCINQPPQDWLSGNCQVLVVQNCRDIMVLFNAISRIYTKLNQWEEQLRDVVESLDSFIIEEFLQVGISFLENSIQIKNSSLMDIFSVKYVASAENEKRMVMNEFDTASFEFFEVIKKASVMECTKKESFVSEVVVDGKRSYCRNLFYQDFFAGVISVYELQRPFMPSDYYLMDCFFDHFHKAFAKYLSKAPQAAPPRITAFRNLLAGLPLSVEEMSEFVLGEHERWACLKLKSLRKHDSLPLHYICTALDDSMGGKVFSCNEGEQVFGLIKLDCESEQSREKQLCGFEEYIGRMGYMVGVSSDFCNLEQIDAYMKQAGYAILKGAQAYQTNTETLLYRFDTMALHYLLDNACGAIPIQCLAPQGFNALLRFDKENNTEYVYTLDVYLKNEMRISATAAELFLHRSSLLNRLERLNTLLKLDLDDPDTRLLLRMYLRMLGGANHGL